MNKYEVMYIIRSGTADDVREAAIKKYAAIVEKDGGKVDHTDRMGNRKFAYPIDYKNEGYYVLMNFQAKPTLIAELERQMRISDEIVRFMCINTDSYKELPPRKVAAPKVVADKDATSASDATESDSKADAEPKQDKPAKKTQPKEAVVKDGKDDGKDSKDNKDA